jgi:hypothetical protein
MFKHFTATVCIAALFVQPAWAAEQKIDAMENGQIEFVTPSGNIGCLYTPEGGTDVYQPKGGGPELICERVEPAYVTVILGPEGDPELIENPGEQSCCGAQNVIEYGNSVDLDGVFICGVETTGLVCEREDGTGFSMARAGIELVGADDETDDTDGDDTDED